MAIASGANSWRMRSVLCQCLARGYPTGAIRVSVTQARSSRNAACADYAADLSVRWTRIPVVLGAAAPDDATVPYQEMASATGLVNPERWIERQRPTEFASDRPVGMVTCHEVRMEDLSAATRTSHQCPFGSAARSHQDYLIVSDVSCILDGRNDPRASVVSAKREDARDIAPP